MSNQQAWKIDSVEWSESCRGAHVQLHGVEGLHYFTAGELAAAGITPPPDPPNFDTLPVGTVLRFNSTGSIVVNLPEKGWWNIQYDSRSEPTIPRAWTVVYSPSAPSVRTALHTIGLTDDELTLIGRHGRDCIDLGDAIDKIVAAVREAEAQP